MKPVSDFQSILKPRPKKIHKRQLGHILVVAGSYHMSGAASLTALAALRSGVGLITMSYPERLERIFRKTILEAMHLPLPENRQGSISSSAYKNIKKEFKKYDLMIIGPGLSRSKSTEVFCKSVISRVDLPMVIDADALNALADLKLTDKILKNRTAATVLTPHHGEMERLINKKIPDDLNERQRIVKKYSGEWNAHIVLKGYRTIIGSPQGVVKIDQHGGPVLATAGSGDVLSGILGTLVVQNIKETFKACCVAVHLHSLTGSLAAKDLGEKSVIASDLINYIPSGFDILSKIR
ncbi:NAD(P)H-hydrate dehydratase [Patescibacteria group bacterium]|nr:NAD(P)H-hydrate dehydratase [Patescibacteria group bacterium]MBU0964501.1 NAD(P)H-hydrate dehydratase [Patescibacteria group bacterium]